MKSRDRVAMEKMAAYAKELLSYVDGMDYSAFSDDSKTINACAFLIGQLGELTTVISDEAQAISPEIPWRNIKGMRNRIIHDYEKVDYIVLWKTIIESIPQLIEAIQITLEAVKKTEA
jgi:uncharacterized protein with HEPN domain